MIFRLLRDEEGQAAAEYGLIASAVVIGVFIAAQGLRYLQSQAYDNQHQALREWRAP